MYLNNDREIISFFFFLTERLRLNIRVKVYLQVYKYQYVILILIFSAIIIGYLRSISFYTALSMFQYFEFIYNNKTLC